MSSSIPPQQGDSEGGGYSRPAPVSSHELLPPVEPPSAGFIIQLFVVPAVIVAAVVLVWFAIESLARRGEQDPAQIVAALRSNNQARFQQAKELADMLRLPERYPKMKANRELAEKLAAYLDELVEAGDPGEASVTMRYYLAGALGEFLVDDGLPALLKTAREDAERDVRRRAVNAIAVLAGGIAGQKPPQPLHSEELTQTLLELADDQDELVRSETAFALGVIAAAPGADSQLISKLEELADDPYTDTRFNAGVGLAGVGSPKAAAAIAEMFDPDSMSSSLSGEKALNAEVTEAALLKRKADKRNTILTNALKATNQLLASKQLPASSFAALQTALERFIADAPKVRQPAPISDELVDEAQRTLTKVKARAVGK